MNTNGHNLNLDNPENIKIKNPIEKFSSIPSMLKCYLCEDFCEDAVQITCCYENFCDKHIKEEIMKNFTCPNCKCAATMRDIVPNKKLRENIVWFKSIVNEINIQNQNKQQFGSENIIPNVPTTNIAMNTLQEKSAPIISILQSDVEYKQIGTLDNIAERNEKDMTPEEKMQMFDKHDDSEKATERTMDRKITEEKIEVESKSLKDTTSNAPLEKQQQGNITHPHQIPFMPMPPYMSMGMNPIKPEAGGVAASTAPGNLMYYGRMDPRMYYHMMGAGYPYTMGMYPMGMTSQTEEKTKAKKSHRSRSSSSSSRSNSKHDRHKKKRRSRSKSRSRSHRRSGKTKGRDKERDRDRDRDRERKNDKDKEKEKSRTNKKHK